MSFKARLLRSPTPPILSAGNSGSTGSPVAVCQTLPLSFSDKQDGVGLGSSVQSLHTGDSFALSAFNSLPVVISSIMLAANIESACLYNNTNSPKMLVAGCDH